MYVKTKMWKYEEAYFKMNTFIYNFTNSDAATTEFRAQIQVKNVWNNNPTTFLCTSLLFDVDATKSVPRWRSKTPRRSRNRWLVAILIGIRQQHYHVCCSAAYSTQLFFLWDWKLSFLVHFYIFLPWYKIERKYSYNKPLLVIEHGTQRRVNHTSLL